MPSKRDLKLDMYDIGKYAYRELRYFCLRYPEMKRQLADLRNPYASPCVTGLPHGNSVGRPTEDCAERAAELSSSCEAIEQAALEAGGKDYAHLLLAVTQDVPWHYLQMLKGMTTGRDAFNEMRRRFFFFLARKKKII